MGEMPLSPNMMMPQMMAPIMPDDNPEPVGPVSRPVTPPLFEKLVKHCKELFDQFEGSAYRGKKIEEIEASYRTYNQDKDPNLEDWPFDGAENIVLPLVTITVDNVEPRLVAGMIGKTPIVRLEMTGMEEKDPSTEILEDWFNKELLNTVKIKPSTIRMIHTMLLEGTVYPIPKYTLKEKKKKRFKMDQQTGMPMMGQDMAPVKEEYTASTSEGGELEFAAFSDVYCPDDIGTIEEWEECDKIRIVRPTYVELQRVADRPGYINIGPWLVSEKVRQEEVEKSPGQKVAGVEITGKEVIECMECHISYPIYQDEEKEEDEQTNFEEERVVVTIDRKSDTIIRFIKQTDLCMENNSLIKRVRLFPEMGKSYGTTIYEKLKAVQQGGSDLLSMIINIAYLVMMPWFFYDAKSGLRGEIKLNMGTGVKVDDVNGVKFPEFRMNPREYLDFLNIFMSLWEKIGNISDTQIGRVNESKTTATEVMTVVQEGNIKHNYQAEIIKDEFVKILEALYDLYYEKMPPDKKFIYGGKQVQIPFGAMKRGYRFVLESSTEIANKLIDRREKEDLMTVLGNDPLMNPLKPREELLKSYGITEIDQWINPQIAQGVMMMLQNPEIVQVMGQYTQEKAQVQGALGRGGKGGPPTGGPGAVQGTGANGRMEGVPA